MAKPPTCTLTLVILSLLLYLLFLRLPRLRSEAEPAGADISKELELKIQNLNMDIRRNAALGLINIGKDELRGWRTQEVKLQKAPKLLQWSHLFPEWIDEEELTEAPSCPDLPIPDLSKYDEVDVVVARLPCRHPHPGWARDIFRLQTHLAAAHLAAVRTKQDHHGRVKLIFLSKCQPMMEIFKVEDIVSKEEGYWFYRSDVAGLQLKISMPVGSCRLSPPLMDDNSEREAYATVLHSSEAYVCGAIVLAHSIRRSGSRRDLVLLHDQTISVTKLQALSIAGWKLRVVDRIRNPNAEEKSYNEYNYSKLRLWQMTEYDKVVFLDADALVLRNIDYLFRWPEMAAAGNDGFLFNSGVMVIEPSNATFSWLMSLVGEVISYNGGDQGFLNEAFVWWHRLPRKVNSLKISSTVMSWEKADVVHYLGQKPWLCHRDYDCNWNIKDGRIYANEEVHEIWWSMHDGIAAELKGSCRLPAWRESMIEEERRGGEVVANLIGRRDP